MTTMQIRPGRIAAAAAAVLLAACATVAFEPDRSVRAPVLEGFGAREVAVSSPVPQARQLFAQGLALGWAFNHLEAVRSFKAALAADPSCAMCAWGVAWQMGPSINGRSRHGLKAAQPYLELALRHAPGATPRERELIAALALRHDHASQVRETAPLTAAVCGKAATGSERAHPLELAYAQRLEALAAAHPDDPDIAALWVEAVMVARPDLSWPTQAEAAPAPELQALASGLERALARHPDHTGLNHYMVHLMDQPSVAIRALPAAERLARLAPDAPHLVHMPSHTYAHLGRYAEAVSANVLALQAEQRYRQRAQAQGFKPEDNWVYHNQHFLWFAALMMGQGDTALAAARGNVRSFGEGDDPYLEYVRSLPIFTLARLERWEEVLREPAPQGKGVAPAMNHGARGLALARLGRLAEAKTELASLQQVAGRLRGDGAAAVSGGQAFTRAAVDISLGRLQAEIAAAEGRWEDAEAHQRRALQAAAPFDQAEPAMYGAGMRVALGELLLRAGKPGPASAVFQEELTERPLSGWALRGLMQGALAQGDAQEAARHAREFDRVWARADSGLRVPR